MDALAGRIGHAFRDAGLLRLALTHPSRLNEPSNQRLEFLGDAVLGAVVAALLYQLFPDDSEGELARRKAALVRTQALARCARDIGLSEALILGASEQQGRNKDSTLEDTLEALIGALYLDGGMPAAEAFIRPRWTVWAHEALTAAKDAKTALQEWAQSRGLPVPVYRLVATEGAAHAPMFTIAAIVQGQPPEQASAPVKRAAEQQAAKALLTRLGG